MDMSQHVAPKSSQLNADDLLSGPRTITIARVSGTGNAEQPVAISFDGDEGRPYLPCKSMRRLMIAAWGVDAGQYVGRSLTLFRDPAVLWGGMAVGGLRIAAMSHIERPLTIVLTETKKSRKPYTVKVLAAQQDATAAPNKGDFVARDLIARIQAAHDIDAIKEITGADIVIKQRDWLKAKRPELATQVDEAVAAALAAVEGA